MQDQTGTYDLSKVIAVKKGGTPHPELNLGFREPIAILVYESGAEVVTFLPYSQVAQVLTDRGKPPLPAAPAP